MARRVVLAAAELAADGSRRPHAYAPRTSGPQSRVMAAWGRGGAGAVLPLSQSKTLVFTAPDNPIQVRAMCRVPELPGVRALRADPCLSAAHTARLRATRAPADGCDDRRAARAARRTQRAEPLRRRAGAAAGLRLVLTLILVVTLILVLTRTRTRTHTRTQTRCRCRASCATQRARSCWARARAAARPAPPTITGWITCG